MPVRDLMITCPATGKTLKTGIAIDEQSFATATLTGNAVQCPHCGAMHVWDKKDAFLEPAQARP